jgi:hypothetical protein
MSAQRQQPSIGRVVHYRSYGTPGGEYRSEPRAAVITAVHASADRNPMVETFDVDLCILNPTGLFFTQRVPYADKPAAGHWNWPPYVAPK